MEAMWQAIQAAVQEEGEADVEEESGDDPMYFDEATETSVEDERDILKNLDPDVIDVSSRNINPSPSRAGEAASGNTEPRKSMVDEVENAPKNVNVRKFDESMEEENFAKDFDFDAMKAMVQGKQSLSELEESEESHPTTEFVESDGDRRPSMGEDVVLRADGGPQVISENEFEIEIQNAFFRRKIQKWKNKTLADEMSMKYWGRKAPDFIPPDPMSLYEGDMSTEEVIGNLTESRERAFAAMEQYVNDSFLFSNFLQGMYNMPPLVEIEVEDKEKYENLTQEMKAAIEGLELDRALELEEMINEMKYEYLPTWNQDEEDSKWFDEGMARKQGLKWDTEEEFMEIVDGECEEHLEAMEKLGLYFNPETLQFEQALIPFSATPGACFNPKLVGKGVALSNDYRTATRSEPGRPAFALFPMDKEEEMKVMRWRIRCDRSISNIFVGVLKIPFAPTEGAATLLATPAWFINSEGEAYRTGPSQTEDDYEVIDKENMTLRDEKTKVWEEGYRFNPKYRKEGCEMIVDPITGDISWFEADEVTRLAEAGGDEYGVAEFGMMQGIWLVTTFGREKVEVDLFRWLQVDNRRRANESWIDAYNRSVADGFWDELVKEVPEPDYEKLGYKNCTQEEIVEGFANFLQEKALEAARAHGIPEDYCYPQECFRTTFRFGPHWNPPTPDELEEL
eukprot:760348-Hanusia_phi.AAC.8